MTKKGFEEYLYTVYDRKNGTAGSYVVAIRIIDELFKDNDVFHLNGKSIACIDDPALLTRISEFVRAQQSLYKKGIPSFFQNTKANQTSYPEKGFCSAALGQLLNYCAYDADERSAEVIVRGATNGAKVSKELSSLFKVDKEGKDKQAEVNVRLGQGYFRKMVLANYNNKCCVSGLNVPQTLIASHIVAWADNKAHRMDPENGLCLSATYDAAFDKHLISFDEDYRMIVSKEIKDYFTNEVTKEYFGNYEGKQIILPAYFLPSQKLLARHRELLVG